MFYSTDHTSQSPFVHGIFGVQHESPPNSSQLHHIDTLNNLIESAADHVECFQERPSNSNMSKSTTLWLSYWRSNNAYLTWWQSTPVQAFWSSLRDDAGVWKEVIRAKPSRCQYGNSQNVATGMAILSSLKESDKAGFWGSYRARVPDSEFNSFESPLKQLPSRRRIERARQNIEHGRVKFDGCPNNVCFVREGQYRELIPQRELDIWNRDMEKHAQDWFSSLTTNPEDSGLLSIRICKGPTSLSTAEGFVSSSNTKSTQIGFFLDLGHLERAARSLKPHLCLRDTFRWHYGPDGKLSEGKSVIWVEMFLLEPGDFEAEYIGCLEGTGFLGYEDHPSFQNPKGMLYLARSFPRRSATKCLFALLIALVVLFFVK